MLDGIFSLRCPDCGGKIKDAERYCPHCGVDLEAPIAPNNLVGGKTAQEYFDSADIDYELNTNLKQALIDCELAIQLDSNFAEAHNLRGLILDEMGRLDEAIASYREAIRLNPDLEEAKANLRDAEAEYLANGRKSRPVVKLTVNSVLKYGAFTIIAALVILVVLRFGYRYFDYAKDFVAIYLVPKSSIVFVPDLPDGMVVDKQDLEVAAQILTDRCMLLGYSYATFDVSSAGEIVGRIPVTMDAAEIAEKIDSIGLLEFVDFGDMPVAEGTVIRTDLKNKYLPQVEGQEWHTVMSNDGVLTAIAVKSQTGEYADSFALTKEGSKIFLDHTTQNIGKYLGIVLDRYVVSVPIIQTPIQDGQGQISGKFTRETAQELAVTLQTKPLPFPIKLKK
jgi:hypothetical protein